MKHSERFALDHWLSEYPAEKTYDEVCDLISEESEDITLWEMVEHYPSTEVIDQMENTRLQVERMLDNLLYGVCLSAKTEEESRQEGAM